jgi:hypothetical protein
MTQQARAVRFEPRWPVGLSILAVLFLLVVLPERIRVLPAWVTYALGVAVLAPIAAVGLTAAKRSWLSVERAVVLGFVVVAGAGILVSLANLIDAMLSGAAHASGLQLLTSSIAVWVTNVLIFALLYWQMDRGGPEGRIGHAKSRPDWIFPQDGAPAAGGPTGWHPTFVDYLYLGYSTATAFSAADAVPATPRAKLLMILESSISLVTIVLVVSRAINILGS